MILDHHGDYYLAGSALKRRQLAARRDKCALAYIAARAERGEIATTRDIAATFQLPARSARHIVERLRRRKLIEPSGAGYAIVKVAA